MCPPPRGPHGRSRLTHHPVQVRRAPRDRGPGRDPPTRHLTSAAHVLSSESSRASPASVVRQSRQVGSPHSGSTWGHRAGRRLRARGAGGAKAEHVIVDMGWEEGHCEREGQRPGLCLLAPRVAPLKGVSAEAGRLPGGHLHSPHRQRGHSRGLGGVLVGAPAPY